MIRSVLTCPTMSNQRIHRYILREIVTPTVLSLLIFTFVLLMGKLPKLTELVINKGIPTREILQLFGCLLPSFLIITIPLSFLLGILLTFGRLSADSEFIALKASGISLYQLVKPVLLLAFLFTLLNAWITITIEPASKTAFRNKLFRIASNSTSIGIKPGIFIDEFNGIVLYTRGMDENRNIMHNVFISDEREGETPATIIARQGRFLSNPDRYSLTLQLSNGTIHRRPLDEKQSTYQIIKFTTYDINLDIGNLLSGKRHRRSRGELSWAELTSAIKNESNNRKRLYFQTNMHYRIATSIAPFVLVLIGVPLGLQSQRSGKGSGFFLALMIFVTYYTLLSFSVTISDKGLIPAAIILWFPNFCFLLGGSWLLHRTAIEKPLQIFSLQKIVQRWTTRRNKTGDDS